MTVENITERIQEIVELQGDPESAHAYEDMLYYDFVKYISENEEFKELSEKAKLILTVEMLDYPRWYA